MFTGFLNDMSNDYEVGADLTSVLSRLLHIRHPDWARITTTSTNQTISEATPSGMVDFNLHSPAARCTALKGFCDTVRAGRHAVSTSVPWGFSICLGSTICFYEEFEAWKG